LALVLLVVAAAAVTYSSAEKSGKKGREGKFHDQSNHENTTRKSEDHTHDPLSSSDNSDDKDPTGSPDSRPTRSPLARGNHAEDQKPRRGLEKGRPPGNSRRDRRQVDRSRLGSENDI
jgi:hypothetical protein